MNSAESVQRAIDELNKQELDGRALIIEVAKPADQKEKKERKSKRKPGRRGSKAGVREKILEVVDRKCFLEQDKHMDKKWVQWRH